MNAPAFRDYDAEFAEQHRLDSLRNVEVEQVFLGCLLTWNHVLDACDGQLEPGHFCEGIHARIFEASASLIRDGRQASPITLKTYFTQDDTLLQIGGVEYLVRLAGSATMPKSAGGYARLIRELAMRRAAVRLAERAIDDLYALPIDLPPETFVAGLAEEFSGLAGSGTGEQTQFSADALAILAIDAVAKAYQGGADPDAIPSGLKALDAKTSLCRGDLGIMGARPSMGKTAVGLALCANVARRGEPALFISLEMRAKRLGQRLLSMATAQAGRGMIGYSRMGAGRISEPEFGHIVDITKEHVSRWPLTIEDRSSMTVAMISAAVSQIKQKQPGLALVVVDYLGLVAAGDRYRGRKVDEVGEICAGLKEIAKRSNVCLLALHQLSRANESRENKRPVLSDLRDAGNIEQDADVVIFPYREAYYLARALEAAEPGSSDALKLNDELRAVHDTMELIVAKNRHGPIGTVKVRADMATNLITDIASEPGQEAFL